MDTKYKPATPLPWSRKDGHYQHVRGDDINYFIHAANAYPRLVKALKGCVAAASEDKIEDFSKVSNSADGALALLRELGEL